MIYNMLVSPHVTWRSKTIWELDDAHYKQLNANVYAFYSRQSSVVLFRLIYSPEG